VGSISFVGSWYWHAQENVCGFKWTRIREDSFFYLIFINIHYREYSIYSPALLVPGSRKSTFQHAANRQYRKSNIWRNTIYRGYQTVARRYGFYVQVAKTISHEWAQRTSEILFLSREHKSISSGNRLMFCLLYGLIQSEKNTHKDDI
jgi:hypothetical protein